MATRCRDVLGRYEGERRRLSEHLPKRSERLLSCRRLAALYAVLDLSDGIEREHLMAALAL